MVQTHVTWGENTVFNTPAPSTTTPPKSTSLFSQPSPAPSTFATPAPSTAGAFSFSSTPVATPQINPAPAPSATSSFFSPTTPAPAPTGLAGFSFGTPQQQNPAMTMSSSLGAPQQAALQAHLNASMAQESSRLESQLLQLHAAYSPYQATTTTTTATNNAQTPGFGMSTLTPTAPQQALNATCRFQHIFYDAMTPAQKMEKMSLGTGNYPQKPQHIPNDVWNQALSQNPNAEEYIPVLITSASGLHSRLVSQQSKMALLESYLDKLEGVLKERLKSNVEIEMRLNSYLKRDIVLKRKLMTVMQKVDMCRGKNVPLQPAEMEMVKKLQGLFKNITDLGNYLEKVKGEAEVCQRQLVLLQQERRPLGFGASIHTEGGLALNDADRGCIHDILNRQGSGLEELRKVLKKDERDLGIIKASLNNSKRHF
mmetsp:Transcript_8486/g.12738  ORF Transcript_8486/g.12738 Transcript_8486/m.12738 type:complete len:426 (+) Transcript_8486:150-1427(+)